MIKYFSLLLIVITGASALAKGEGAPTRWVDLPQGCYGNNYPCALSHQRSGDWKWQGRSFVVAANTSVVLIDENTLQIMSGDLWSEEFRDLKVKHGVFIYQVKGDALLNRRDKKLQVVNLNGEVSVVKSGIHNESIPAGFTNWYEGIAQGGEYRQGVLAPWKSSDLAILFRKMPDLAANMKSKVKEYRDHRKSAVTESAKLYSKVADIRRIASETAQSEREMRVRKTREEKSRIRKMYRDRYFNP